MIQSLKKNVRIAQLRNYLLKPTNLEQFPEATNENLYYSQPHVPSRNILEWAVKVVLIKMVLRLQFCLLNFVDTCGFGCHGETSRKGGSV